MVFANFRKIDVFKKCSKNLRFWIDFDWPKPRKINEKSCSKTCFFWTSIFLRFFRIFAVLMPFWEVPSLPKINKKSKKSPSGRFWSAFGFFVDFGSDVGSILKDFELIFDEFWKDFGKILEIFWKDLASILKTIWRIFEELLCLRTCVDD